MSGFRPSGSVTLNTIVLTPKPGTVTYNRSGFLIHGGQGFQNKVASKGCIIIEGADVRSGIYYSGDRDLEVVP
jgi:hypothetical protein